jgi:hypothetical protein
MEDSLIITKEMKQLKIKTPNKSIQPIAARWAAPRLSFSLYLWD